MKQRYLSLDFLRGFSVFGMVFSAIIPYGILPGWMYHIQNPPPLHILDTGTAGIGWVDLVFPVFIFCMGVSIPFAWRGKISQNEGTPAFTVHFIKETLTRFFMLWLFSYLYVFLNFSNNIIDGEVVGGIWPQVFTILGFAVLFPVYMVIKKKNVRTKWLRTGGVAAACALIAAGHFYFGEVISLQRRGIIIFLLSFLYLFGAIIWYFTRNNLKGRVIIFAIVLVFTLVSQYAGLPELAYSYPGIRWWFNMEYIYFLLLLIPATYTGDILYGKITAGEDFYRYPEGKTVHIAFLLIPALVIWLCYAFYMRLYRANLIVSGSTLIILWYIVKTRLPRYKEMFFAAASLLLCALAIEPLYGGIKKVPCTVQYCFATCSISIMLLMLSDYICKYFSGSLFADIFSGAGKNPLMSYIAFDSLVMPAMKITGLAIFYRAAYPPGMPLLGVLRAAVAVLFTMWLVSLFTKKKIFWKA